MSDVKKDFDEQAELADRARMGDPKVEYVPAEGENDKPYMHDNGGAQTSDQPYKRDYQDGEEKSNDRPAEGKFEEVKK